MKKIVIVNGKGGSGKDTFSSYCMQHLAASGVTSDKISSIDPVKRIAKSGGWDGKKDKKSRRLLSDLKDLFTAYNDLSFDYICHMVSLNYVDVLFVDIREPEEIARIKEKYGKKCITTVIFRDSTAKEEYGNHADDNVFDYTYDVSIDNSKTLENLKTAAKAFCRDFRLM